MTPEELLAKATADLTAVQAEVVTAKASAEEALVAKVALEAELATATSALTEAKASADDLAKQVLDKDAIITAMKAEATTASMKAAQIVGNLASAPVAVSGAADVGFKSFEEVSAELKAISDPKAKAEFWANHRKVVSAR